LGSTHFQTTNQKCILEPIFPFSLLSVFVKMIGLLIFKFKFLRARHTGQRRGRERESLSDRDVQEENSERNEGESQSKRHEGESQEGL